MQVLVRRHCAHWRQKHTMPDVTDRPSMSYKDLQIWLKQKRKSRLKPHTKMPGVCAKWQNQAYDFALSFGKVPCRFKDKDDILNDLIPDFIVCSWVFYVSLMVCIITCISVSSIVVCIRAYSSPATLYR